MAYMVASSSGEQPHFVQKGKGNKVCCDERCAMWRVSKICSHFVAVAEKLNAKYIGVNLVFVNVTQFVKTAHIEEINFERVVKFTQLLLLHFCQEVIHFW